MQVLQVKVWNFILSHGDSPKSSCTKVNYIMLVVAREKSEHKKEVMMMVAIKKEETQGGGEVGV